MKILTIVLTLLIVLGQIEAKGKISRIDQSNFQKFSKDGSYWIMQISNSPCPECQAQEEQLLQTAQLLEGVCKIGKVDAKFLKGMQIPNNPTYLFLRSDKLEENTEFAQKKISKVSLAKFCLEQVEKAVKKRHKTLFGDAKAEPKNSRESPKPDSGSSGKKYDGTKIIDLSDKDFQKNVLQSKDAWFVLFYSPGCGHCRSLEPEYEKLPGLMGKKVNIARIDATVNQKMAQKYQIRGFPTMLMFEVDGKQNPTPYQGQRTAEDIKTWLDSKKLSKPIKQLKELTKKAYEWSCNRNIVCFVFILNSKSDKSQLKFIKPLLEETIDKPIEFFYSERLPALETQLMIEDRSVPKMVATWEGISSYRVYTGGNNYEDLNGFIDHLMERRKWIKFEKKSTDLLFGTGTNQQL